MSNLYSKEWFNQNIKLFSNAYFDKDNAIVHSPEEKQLLNDLGIKKLNNNITQKYEEETIEGYLNNGDINEVVVAWKAGRLKKEGDNYEIEMKDGNYLNGYGRIIKSNVLKDYLNKVPKIDSIDEEKFEIEYKKYLDAGPVPDNFGAVYIINLMYFKSSGKWPIYDKFAHKALKAILMEKSPGEIWVGDAPLKAETDKVTNMYLEYCWLLNCLFGSKEIDRKIDRALWVYGHATKRKE